MPKTNTSTPAADAATVEGARATVEALYATEREWSKRERDARARLAQLEGESGAVALDSPELVAEHTTRIAEAGAEIKIAERAISTARARRVEAIRVVYQREAAELRQHVAAKRADADARQRETDRLLAELRAHEGCEYVPYRPDYGAGVAGDAPALGYQLPRTAVLRREAATFEASAAEREARQPATAGAIERAESVADLLAQLEALGAFTLVPTEAAVASWAAKLAERFDAEIVAYANAGRAVALVYTLIWRDGEIDPRASGAELAETAPAFAGW